MADALHSWSPMSGKAVLFAQLAAIEAVPICLAPTGLDEFVGGGAGAGPSFDAIDLEAIAAPACFEVERGLQGALDIPPFTTTSTVRR
ncbi:hypothetical protein AB0L34_03680 [Micromonospora sp. NPDC052213]|uniref:hypothetical protein n=1 Tax=Micromonospora sp. NPDC052213 TaxID=3155812 RepID=UPI00343CB588